MNDEKWDQLCERLEEQYPELNRYREQLEAENGGYREVLEFEGPVGQMRVVRVSKPAVVDVQHHYSHRQGATASTEYKFSDTEFTHKLHIYKEADGEWGEMDASSMGM
jgi:hypothetical protein